MSPVSALSRNPLFARDIISDASNAANTLSSWSNCMAKAYCKWPVIVAIIVGGLIALSVLTCIVRFCCCGLECCFWCCSCCNKCCPSPKGAKGKYSQTPQQPPPQTYGWNPAMMYGPPQFATFDASSGQQKITEDSLPPMPSWQTAQTTKVEDESALKKEAEHVTPADQQLYEDPDESQRPMLSSDSYHDPYNQQQQQQQQQQRQQQPYANSNAYGYQDGGSYAPTDTSYPQQNQSHPYSQYDQQLDTYSNAPVTPSSTYTAGYPPTYHTQPPTVRSFSRPISPRYGSSPPPSTSSPQSYGQQYQSFSTTGPTAAGPTGYRGATYSPPPSQHYAYNPPVEAQASQAPMEMPGSLVPGGGQRYYSQNQQPEIHELGDQTRQ